MPGRVPLHHAAAPRLPFEANADRRHRIPKQRHRVTNWAEYDAALRQRGSLTVWFSEEAIAAWRAEPRATRGGQPSFSALAIATALTLRAVFRPALRRTEGLIGSVIALLGLDLPVPGHSTSSRRAETLEAPRPASGPSGEPVHLLVDSTGLRSRGPGGWPTEKHGTTRRRSWRVADGEARHHAAPVLAGGRRRSTAPRGAGPGASRISPRTPTPGGSSHRRSPARMPTTARRSAPCSSRSTVPSRPSPPTARPAAMTSTPRPRRAILTPTSSSHRARARCRAARARPLRRGGTAICEPSPGAAASDGRRPRGTVGAPWWSPTSRASSG